MKNATIELVNTNNGNTMKVNSKDAKFYLSKGYVMKSYADNGLKVKAEGKSVATKTRKKKGETWSDAEKSSVMLKNASGLSVLRNWMEGYHQF